MLGTVLHKVSLYHGIQTGSHSTKAKTLSRMDPSKDEEGRQCWVNAKQWYFDREVANSLPFHVPDECPANCTYVLDARGS